MAVGMARNRPLARPLILLELTYIFDLSTVLNACEVKKNSIFLNLFLFICRHNLSTWTDIPQLVGIRRQVLYGPRNDFWRYSR
jgi:hypothetical protein